MSHLLSPGDLIITTGNEWAADWKNTVAIVIKQYEPRLILDDEPRWLAMSGKGDIVVFRHEVDIVNEHADGTYHE